MFGAQFCLLISNLIAINYVGLDCINMRMLLVIGTNALIKLLSSTFALRLKTSAKSIIVLQ
jgi:hypothetical protein